MVRPPPRSTSTDTRCPYTTLFRAEILNATDKVTIMRGGRVVERAVTAETDAAGLARGMVGRDVVLRSSAAGLGLLEEAERTVEQRTSATPDLDEIGRAHV